MFGRRRTNIFILVIGDLFAMVVALWLTLGLRYSALPTEELFVRHLQLFGPVFVLWLIGFFIFNLYGKPTAVYLRNLPLNLFRAQFFNSAVAALIFYFLPRAGTPKTILFIDLLFSVIVLLVWRTVLGPTLTSRRKEQMLLLGSSAEAKELERELTENERYSATVHRLGDNATREEILDDIYANHIATIVFDFKNHHEKELVSNLGVLALLGIKFIDVNELYEELFDRVPLSLINDHWFFENISSRTPPAYDILKRAMDIVIGIVAGVVSLLLYPFVILAIKLDDGGPVFSIQERIGKGNQVFHALKFRTMSGTDKGAWGAQGKDLRVTRAGRFLRASRIDELPQLWNILRGDMSLIGPRPDIIDLGKKLATEIPYYTVRNIIPPGLSGWAQISQDLPPRSVEETRERLSYDFYYLKHRSLLLDVKIALRTIKTLLSRSGL